MNVRCIQFNCNAESSCAFDPPKLDMWIVDTGQVDRVNTGLTFKAGKQLTTCGEVQPKTGQHVAIVGEMKNFRYKSHKNMD